MQPHNYCASFKATKHTQEKGGGFGGNTVPAKAKKKNERIHPPSHQTKRESKWTWGSLRLASVPHYLMGGNYTSQWRSQAGGYLSAALLFTNSYWSRGPVLKDQNWVKITVLAFKQFRCLTNDHAQGL